MLNILILTPYIPYPINSGANRNAFETIDRIRKCINITMAFSIKKSEKGNIEKLQQLWPEVKIYTHLNDEEQAHGAEISPTSYYRILKKIQRSTERKINRLARKNIHDNDSFIRSHSGMYTKFYEPFESHYITFINKVISENNFDLIEVNYFELINLINILPSTSKNIYVQHEIKYVVEEQRYALMDKPTPTDTFLLNYIRNYETQNIKRYDNVITVTDTDNAKMREVLKLPETVYTSEAIINTDKTYDLKEFIFNNQLIFLGLGDHFPNHQGLDWFLNNCWHYLQTSKPGLTLKVIGKWNKKLAETYTSRYKNVKFIGYVEDLHDELQNSLMIVPIHIGSGLRIKIMDGVIHGCPIVTTTIGVEGNDLVNGKSCLIADDAISFTNNILHLIDNNELCDTIRKNAIESLLSRPTPEELAKKRLDIYKVISGK